MNLDFLKRLTPVGLFFILGLTAGCATYQGKVESARNALTQHNYEKALKELKPLAEKDDGDQLAYLMDYGTAQELAGQYKESNVTFEKANKLAEAQDYHSISRIAGSLVLNEEMVQYKGDTFEKIFVNAYMAMNYLAMDQLDDALVESRRINEKYLLYRSDSKKNFELNSFGKYLSALVWEAGHNYDDAYIAYEEAYKIDPSIATIGDDLIRSAKLARRMDTYNEWKQKFPSVKEDPRWYDKSMGEIVIIYQQGWGPRKVDAKSTYRLPALKPVHTNTQKVRLDIEGDGRFVSREIYDVQSAATQTLKDDQALLIAKRLAGVAAKAVIADQVRQKGGDILGFLTWFALNASDRADLRQWSTLPQTIQTVRVDMPPGKYKIKLVGLSPGFSDTGENMDTQEVEVKPGQKKFVIWRSLR